MKSFIKILPILAASYLSASLSAHAALLINVNFGGAVPTPAQTGPAVIGTSGDTWNGIFNKTFDGTTPISGGPISLVDSANAATSVLLSYNTLFGYTAPDLDSPFNLQPNAPLMRSFFAAQGTTPGTISLTGLAAGQYSLYLYSAADNGIAQQLRTTTFTANGVIANVGPNSNASTLIQGTNYLNLTVTVLGDGLLNISYVNPLGVGTPGAEGDINGFQLQAVPEPSSVALLLGTGLVTMFIARRRKIRTLN